MQWRDPRKSLGENSSLKTQVRNWSNVAPFDPSPMDCLFSMRSPTIHQLTQATRESLFAQWSKVTYPVFKIYGVGIVSKVMPSTDGDVFSTFNLLPGLPSRASKSLCTRCGTGLLRCPSWTTRCFYWLFWPKTLIPSHPICHCRIPASLISSSFCTTMLMRRQRSWVSSSDAPSLWAQPGVGPLGWYLFLLFFITPRHSERDGFLTSRSPTRHSFHSRHHPLQSWMHRTNSRELKNR